jgi:hypothetical protein
MSGFLLCKSFESGEPLGNYDVVGQISRDVEHVYLGQYALHAHQDGTAALESAVALYDATIPSPDVYVRAFVWVAAPLPSNSVTFFRLQQLNAPQHSLDVQLSGGYVQTRATKTNMIMKSATAFPTGRWVCVEWHIHLASNGTSTVSLDDQAIAGLSAPQDTTDSPLYDLLVLGLESTDVGGPPARDLWMDEVVLDDKPIGCTL